MTDNVTKLTGLKDPESFTIKWNGEEAYSGTDENLMMATLAALTQRIENNEDDFELVVEIPSENTRLITSRKTEQIEPSE